MVLVKLFCVFVGVQGGAFPVKIGRSESVGDLKQMIVNLKPNALKDVDADLLQLFLAKRGEEWLQSKDLLRMRKEETTGEDERDYKSEELEDPTKKIRAIFPRKFPDGSIQVLVEVPKGAGRLASEASTLAQISAQLGEIQRRVTDSQPAHSRKRKFAHAEVGSTNGVELLDALRIQVKNVRTVPFAATEVSSVDPYVWKTVIVNGVKVELTEEQQCKQYLEYVERNIDDVLKKQQLSVIAVEKGENILSVNVPGHKIKLTGRTDLLILSDIVKKFPSETQHLPEVKMLIEVKKDVIQSNHFQAMSELIALDLLVDHPVMALLTDLKENWVFFWVDKETNSSTCIRKAAVSEPGEAFEVIKALLAQPWTAGTATTTEFTLPCFELPVKRLKLKEVLPTVREGGGDIRDSIERYYDIASVLGPDLDMARAVAYQVTRSIPTLS